MRAAPRIVGDGATVIVRCRAASGRLCQGTATLTPATGAAAPRVLAVRRYLQPAGPARSLTLYLSAAALRYLHGGRPVKAVLRLNSRAGGVPTPTTKTITLRGAR